MSDSSKENLQNKQDEFRRAWEQGQRPQISDFLKAIDETQKDEILSALIPIDIEFRAVSGEVLDYADYKSLGDRAARIAAAFFLIDETPGASGLTIDSKPLIQDDLESMVVQQPTSLVPSKTIAGKYKLLQQIGAGGMGSVWLAQQESPVRRRVALKVIRATLGSDETVARFEAERQALAMMNHPNIAQVLDAGTMEDGSPFFVMEMVNGVPLNRYCNENRLTVEQRLALLIPVCDAIQHAHQKGIIHRDIKPSNILVSIREDKPVPKVIDFGLAKALEHQHRLTDQSLFTEQGRVVGTLQYMSPEQAGSNELDVDARTDIYSLGVVLYQLLTGSTPLDRETVANNTLLQIIEIICDSEIQRPSQRLKSNPNEMAVASKQKQIEPNRLLQLLQGELDWIVLQALEKDRTLRYQTATGLAEDLSRFINKEPVLARPPSATYLIGKFVRKHRGFVASVCLATALLIGGICTSTYYAFKANRQKNRADNQLEVYKALFSSANPLSGAKKDMTAIDLLQEAEAVVMEKFDDDPIGRAAMLHQIGTTYRGRGLFNLARESLLTAHALRRENLGADDLETLDTQAELAITYQSANQDEMLRLMKDVYERRKKTLASDDADMIESRHMLATASFFAYKEKKKAGETQPELIAQAQDMFEENYRIQVESHGANHDDTLKTLTNLANVYLKNMKIEKSIQLGRQALTAWQQKVDAATSEKSRNTGMTSLLITKNNFAEALFANGEIKKAIDVFAETLRQKEQLYDLGHSSWRTTLRLLLSAMLRDQQNASAEKLFTDSFSKVQESSNVFNRQKVLEELRKDQRKLMEQYSVDENWNSLDNS